MTEAALSKSLDDLIKEQRHSKEKQKKQQKQPPKHAAKVVTVARPKPGGAGEGGAGRRRRGSVGGGPSINPANLSVTVKGAIRKPRPSAPPPRRREDPERLNPELRLSRLEGDQKWGHEMFEGERPRGPRAPSALGTKLFISNLDYKVSKEDLGELFETCGPLASYDIHWDSAGRSTGTGEVVYRSREHAQLAMQRYNNVQLDGRAMALDLIEKLERGAVVGRRLKSGLTLSAAAPTAPRVLTLARGAAQAVAGAVSQPRGRGSSRAVRSQVVSMQE